jgi:hypothetical protein
VDAANVPADVQDKRYQTARENVKQWGSKAVLLRNYTTSAVHGVHEQVFFVYVDARVSATCWQVLLACLS